MIKPFSTALIAMSLLLPTSVLAHAEGHAIVDGDYRIELGSFPEENLQPNETIIFSAVMETLEAEPIYETEAWIRLSQNNTILFSSADFITTDGTVDFEYHFEDHGEYEMTIRMTNSSNDDEATVTFPLTIGDPSLAGELLNASATENRESRFNLAVLTLILGLLCGVFLARYRPKVNGAK